jgi:hypothetical protein
MPSTIMYCTLSHIDYVRPQPKPYQKRRHEGTTLRQTMSRARQRGSGCSAQVKATSRGIEQHQYTTNGRQQQWNAEQQPLRQPPSPTTSAPPERGVPLQALLLAGAAVQVPCSSRSSSSGSSGGSSGSSSRGISSSSSSSSSSRSGELLGSGHQQQHNQPAAAGEPARHSSTKTAVNTLIPRRIIRLHVMALNQ